MKTLTVGWVAVAVLAAAGCGPSAPAPAPQPPPVQETPHLQAAPQPHAPPIPINPPVPPVDADTLIAMLPQPAAGWVRSKPKSHPVAAGVVYTSAEAVFEKGESAIHVEIIDTGFNQLLLAPIAFMVDSRFSERSGDNYKKAARLGGSPGFETWDADARVAEVTVVIADRVIVTAKGRNVDNAAATRALVQAVDQSKLSALK